MRGVATAAQNRRRTLAFIAVGVLAAALGVLAFATDAARDLELTSVDTRFEVRGTRAAPDDVTVVAIDAETFDELDVTWPFPRSLHARLIDRLREAGARVIAYDVQFTEPTDPREDQALIDAVDRADGVVLGTSETNDRGETGVLGGPATLKAIGARVGSMQLPADPGGVLRRLPYASEGLTSLSIVAAQLARGEPVAPGPFRGDGAWIDYRGPAGTVRTVSFADVLRGRVPRGALRDRIVVVGAAAPTLQDVHPTSISSDEQMPGPEIQANAIATVLDDVPLRSSPDAVSVLLIALLGLLVPMAILAWRARWALVVAGAAALALLVGAQAAFQAGIVVPVVVPLLTLFAGATGALVLYALFSVLDRQRVRDTFARFVPESVVDEVLVAAGDGVRLGGVQKTATVLFSDLRGFTSFAETRPPDRVIEILNRYLTQMTEAILDHGGTLVAFMGDGIMAVFGAPLDQDDHADRAVAVAAEMLGPRMTAFNEWLAAEETDIPAFRMGVGVNTGHVMSGNVGSPQRLEYAAIGDTTNTAARLEGMTKDAGCQVLIADATVRALLREPAVPLAPAGDFSVRGRTQQLRCWTLASEVPASAPDPAHEQASA